MDGPLRDLDRRFRASGEPQVAEALLGAASRAGDRALVRATLDALARAWVERRDAGAADALLAFVTAAPDLDHAPGVDALACAGHAVAGGRYRAWWPPLARIVGRSEAMRSLRARVATHARTSEPLLLAGESGVGHHLAAFAAHELSGRPGFVVVYAWERPPATPAPGGTVFLPCARVDEPPPGWFLALRDAWGERAPRWIVGAEARDVEPWERALATRAFEIAPLRARLGDLPLLVGELLARHGAPDASPPAWLLASFAARTWPGNVRELEFHIQAGLHRAQVFGGDPFDPEAWRHGAAP